MISYSTGRELGLLPLGGMVLLTSSVGSWLSYLWYGAMSCSSAIRVPVASLLLMSS
jgi:hypothetical protein